MSGARGAPREESAVASHATAAVWSTLLMLAILLAGWWWSGRQVAERADVMGGTSWPTRSRGTILLRASLRPPDVVPLLGTSELVRQRENRPDEFFATSPTGFRVVAVGQAGMVLVQHALAVGAMGSILHGRTVGVLVSPGEIVLPDTGGRQGWFRGNYSRVQAAAVFIGQALPDTLTRDIARRLLAYDGLGSDPVIEALVRFRAIDGAWGRLGARLLAPAAWLDAAWLALVDRMEGAMALRHFTPVKRLTPSPAVPVNWAALESAARADYARQSSSNPFGIGDDWWKQFEKYLTQKQPPDFDARQATLLRDGPAWGELALLVRTIQAVGATPVLVPMPMKGSLLSHAGVRAETRALYYDRLDSLARAHDVALMEARDFDLDNLFMHDHASHPSAVGWLLMNQALDSLVHHARVTR